MIEHGPTEQNFLRSATFQRELGLKAFTQPELTPAPEQAISPLLVDVDKDEPLAGDVLYEHHLSNGDAYYAFHDSLQ